MTLYTRESSGWFKGLAIIMIMLSHYAEWWEWFHAQEELVEWIRLGISQLGPYGVAIFLLFSGYGLAKSAGDRRIGWKFILKRVVNVYIPYLAVVILIDLLSGGYESVEDIAELFCGQDFWYMTVLFSFYLAFIAIWFVFENRFVRAVLMTVFTCGYNYYLYKTGEQDFWYISNIAFAIGVVLALYEPVMKKAVDKIGAVPVILLGIATVCGVCLDLYFGHRWEQSFCVTGLSMIAVFIFILFIAVMAAVWKRFDPVLPLLGKYSLYFYLSHTFLFMWTINYFECEMSLRFIIAAVLTVVVSFAVGIVMELLLKPVNENVRKNFSGKNVMKREC